MDIYWFKHAYNFIVWLIRCRKRQCRNSSTTWRPTTILLVPTAQVRLPISPIHLHLKNKKKIKKELKEVNTHLLRCMVIRIHILCLILKDIRQAKKVRVRLMLIIGLRWWGCTRLTTITTIHILLACIHLITTTQEKQLKESQRSPSPRLSWK